MDHFNTVTGAVATADDDGDGHDNLAEQTAGTDPLDAASVLALSALERTTATEFVLTWPSASNRFYHLYGSSNLLAAPPWPMLGTNLPATPPENRYTNHPPRASAMFFRLGIDGE
jgi:hypothetical protein